jgi:chaperonin GroES
MNFKPLHDRVAIEPLATEEKTVGGIIIPDTAKEKPIKGKVIAVGDGVKDQNGKVTPLDVRVGDIVIYGKWGGTEVKLDNKELMIMKESDIIGIITK